jgi:hypothetical protein
MSVVFLRMIVPRQETVYVTPDASGNYSESLERNSFRIEANQVDQMPLEITIEPEKDTASYLARSARAFLTERATASPRVFCSVFW